MRGNFNPYDNGRNGNHDDGRNDNHSNSNSDDQDHDFENWDDDDLGEVFFNVSGVCLQLRDERIAVSRKKRRSLLDGRRVEAPARGQQRHPIAGASVAEASE